MQQLKKWNWGGFAFIMVLVCLGFVSNKSITNILHCFIATATLGIPIGLLIAWLGRDKDEIEKLKIYTMKIIVGYTDFNRKKLEKGCYGWGASSEYFMASIKEFEDAGFTVKFKTSILRKVFCMAIYKVVAYKTFQNIT